MTRDSEAPRHHGAAQFGWLADNTASFAPIGLMLADGDRVSCHLCGRRLLSVASHLRAHG